MIKTEYFAINYIGVVIKKNSDFLIDRLKKQKTG